MTDTLISAGSQVDRSQLDRDHAPGEHLLVTERMIVAPAVGIFRPLPPETVTAEGELVEVGQVIGVIEAWGQDHPVHSAFSGFLMGMLASDGERVRAGQPIAWLRSLAITAASPLIETA